MKRLFFCMTILGVMISCMLLFGACGENQAEDKSTNRIFSPDLLTEKLLSDVTFAGTLNKIDEESASFTFSFEEDTEILLYRTDGYYADEVAVFSCDSEAAAKEALAVVNAHVEDLKQSFADYIPEEVPKIESAIVRQHERYVILCITDDTDSAKDIISDFID